MPPQTFKRFQRAAKTEVIRDIDKISEKLDSFDKSTLSSLFKPAELRQLRTFSEEIVKLNSTGVQQALSKQSVPQSFLRDLIDRNDSAGVDFQIPGNSERFTSRTHLV